MHIFMYMDVNKIFGLFDVSGEGSKPDFNHETDMSHLLDNYKEHPMFWVGMFKKLIHNHKTFNHKIMNFFSKIEEEELDLYDVEQAGEFVVYNRAWFWVSKIDIQDRICQEAILHYTDEFLDTYLKFAIHYFQELEEYEKCAHLKKIHDLVVKFLN